MCLSITLPPPRLQHSPATYLSLPPHLTFLPSPSKVTETGPLKGPRKQPKKMREPPFGESSAEIPPLRKKNTTFFLLKRALWTTKKGTLFYIHTDNIDTITLALPPKKRNREPRTFVFFKTENETFDSLRLTPKSLPSPDTTRS